MPETLEPLSETLAEDPTGHHPSRARRGGRVRRAAASVPLTVWAVTALWCALLLGASLIWPMSYGTDEPQHIDMAYVYSAHPFTFYGPGQLQPTGASAAMQNALPGYPPRIPLAQAPIPPRGKRPTFNQLGGHTLLTGQQPNQMVQHPPLYYWMEAVMLRLPGVSGLAWDVQVWLMRLVSILIMAPLPLLCWGTAKRLLSSPFGRLTPSRAARSAVLAAALPLTIPNLVRDGASVQNDTLLILATSVVIWGLARVITGDLRLRTAAVVSAALAVGLWTKGFALALPPIIVLAYLVGAWRAAGGWKTTWGRVWPPLAVCVAGGLAGSFWWVRNLIDYHTVQTNGFGAAYNRVIYGTPDHKGTLSRFLPSFLDQFIMRIWGQIGLPDSPSPGALIIYGWFFIALIGVVAALTIKGARGTRRGYAVLGLIPLAYVAITLDGSYDVFRQWAHDGVRADSGRYLYGGIVVIAALFAVGWYELARPRFQRRFSLLVVAGALVTNAAAWLLILRSWYQPVTDPGYGSGTGKAFSALFRWSPLPEGLTVVLVIVLPVLTGAGCLVALWADGRSPEPTPVLAAPGLAVAAQHEATAAEPNDGNNPRVVEGT